MKTIIAGALVACLLGPHTVFASISFANEPHLTRGTGTTWTWANPQPQGNILYAFATDGTTSVAVGGVGTIYTSANGGAWTANPTTVTTQNLYGITYAATPGLFVAVGEANTILYSTDGINWSAATFSGTPATQNIFSVVYGNGTFVAAGTNGSIFTSTDGINWSESQINSTAGVVTDLAFGAGEFVAVTRSGTSTTSIYYSPDGATWSRANFLTLQPSDPAVYVVFSNNMFMAIGLNINGSTGGSVITSTDGVNWTTQTALAPSTAFPISITGNGSGFVVMLQSSEVANAVTTPIIIETSADGTAWTKLGTNNLPATWAQIIPRQIAYASGTYLTVGAAAYIASSTDLLTWTSLSPSTSVTYEHLRGVHWLNGQFFAVGDNDTILTSAKGITWTKESISVTNKSNLRDIAYGNNRYVVVGSNGVILTSSDGTNWTSNIVASASGLLFEGLIWNGSLFVAVGTGGSIYTSPDGLTWTPRTSGTASTIWNVAWTGANFVAACDSSQDSTRILISSDGIHWTAVPFNTGATMALYGIQWSGIELVASGVTQSSNGTPEATIATSPDGKTWTIHISAVNDTFSDAIINGTEFIAVSNQSGDIYASTDGLHWTVQLPPMQNAGLQSLAKYGDTVVTTGYAGTILFVANQPPTAVNGAVTTVENTPVNGTLQSTGGTVIYTIATQPAHGKAVVTNTGTGAFTYTPNTGFTGSDAFTFSVSNSNGTSQPATETITVTASSGGGTGGGGTSGGGGGGGLDLLSLAMLAGVTLRCLKRRWHEG